MTWRVYYDHLSINVITWVHRCPLVTPSSRRAWLDPMILKLQFALNTTWTSLGSCLEPDPWRLYNAHPTCGLQSFQKTKRLFWWQYRSRILRSVISWLHRLTNHWQKVSDDLMRPPIGARAFFGMPWERAWPLDCWNPYLERQVSSCLSMLTDSMHFPPRFNNGGITDMQKEVVANGNQSCARLRVWQSCRSKEGRFQPISH